MLNINIAVTGNDNEKEDKYRNSDIKKSCIQWVNKEYYNKA